MLSQKVEALSKDAESALENERNARRELKRVTLTNDALIKRGHQAHPESHSNGVLSGTGVAINELQGLFAADQKGSIILK